MSKRQREIYVLANEAKCSGRRFLQGFLSAIGSRSDISLHICEMSDYGRKSLADAITSNRVDGLVTSEIEDPRLAELLDHSDFPLIVIGTRENCLPHRTHNIRIVTVDERKLSATATRHLINCGRVATYGYVHFRENFCRHLSMLREQGFYEALEQCRLNGISYTTDLPEEKSDVDQLGAWLKSIPKPAAILVGYDRRAAEVLEACAKNSITVPGEICVMGIDDDETLAQQTRPRLSSIAIDNISEGRIAAQQLVFLLQKTKKPYLRKTVFSPLSPTIIDRESTRVLAPGLALAQRIREYISANANRAVTAGEVISHIGVSRRLAYLRFKEFAHMSIHQAILNARISYVKKKLLSSRQKICEISRICGFDNINNLKIIFRRLTGMTMREWRAQNGRQVQR